MHDGKYMQKEVGGVYDGQHMQREVREVRGEEHVSALRGKLGLHVIALL